MIVASPLMTTTGTSSVMGPPSVLPPTYPHAHQHPTRGQSMDLSLSRPSQNGSQTTGRQTRPLSLSIFGNTSSQFTSTSTSTSTSHSHSQSWSKSSNKGLGINLGFPNSNADQEKPESFISWLRAHKGTDLGMQVSRCKKLRMLLRHESTFWVASFLNLGGYELILARLKDLLDVEWRLVLLFPYK